MAAILRFFWGLWAIPACMLWTAFVPSIQILGAPFDRGGRVTDFTGRVYMRGLYVLLGVRLHVTGKEHLPDPRTCIVMANHRSYLDIPGLMNALPELSFRFVAKKELTRIPFLGWAIALSEHIVVDRKNQKQAVDALKAASKKLGSNVAVTVFPEGTRAVDDRLLPFKRGGFLLATETGMPILPVSIENSGALFGKQHRFPRPGVVTIRVHAPIPTAGKGRSDVRDLVRATRSAILEGLPESAALEPDVKEESA